MQSQSDNDKIPSLSDGRCTQIETSGWKRWRWGAAALDKGCFLFYCAAAAQDLIRSFLFVSPDPSYGRPGKVRDPLKHVPSNGNRSLQR